MQTAHKLHKVESKPFSMGGGAAQEQEPSSPSNLHNGFLWVVRHETLFSFPQGTSTSFLWAKLRRKGNETSSTATQTQACQFILFCNSITYEQFSVTIHTFLYNNIFTEDLCTGVCSKPCCKTCRSKPCTLQRLLNRCRCRAGQQQYIDYLKLFIQYCVNIAYTKGLIS